VDGVLHVPVSGAAHTSPYQTRAAGLSEPT
jgi:hypothetical protein